MSSFFCQALLPLSLTLLIRHCWLDIILLLLVDTINRSVSWGATGALQPAMHSDCVQQLWSWIYAHITFDAFTKMEVCNTLSFLCQEEKRLKLDLIVSSSVWHCCSEVWQWFFAFFSGPIGYFWILTFFQCSVQLRSLSWKCCNALEAHWILLSF